MSHILSDSEWRFFFERVTASAPSRTGYYNRNYFSLLGDQRVVLRVPLMEVDDMDLRVWPEPTILAVAHEAGLLVPQVLHASASPAFAVVTFIDGQRLDEICPDGLTVPRRVVSDVVHVIASLHRVSRQRLPALPPQWPADGDTVGFAGLLVARTQAVYDAYRDEFEGLFRRFGVPTDPLAWVRDRIDRLSPRPFRFLHSDLHRKNLMIQSDATWVLDWEQALWGDPVYEIATHCHKMGYLPGEQELVRVLLGEVLSPKSLEGVEKDLPVLIAHERCKSIIVDCVRYAKRIRVDGVSEAACRALSERFSRKLLATRDLWGNPQLPSQDVLALFLNDRQG